MFNKVCRGLYHPTVLDETALDVVGHNDDGESAAGGRLAQLLHLSGAKNVSLEYSVFFPLDFDWVEGGKAPGIYGGHDGCSGGDDALDCFSTRLMWRGKGAGELYLVSIPIDHRFPGTSD